MLLPGACKTKSERGNDRELDQQAGSNASAFDLSTMHLMNQVLDAVVAEDPNTALQWRIKLSDDSRPSDLSSPHLHKRVLRVSRRPEFQPRRTGPGSSGVPSSRDVFKPSSIVKRFLTFHKHCSLYVSNV